MHSVQPFVSMPLAVASRGLKCFWHKWSLILSLEFIVRTPWYAAPETEVCPVASVTAIECTVSIFTRCYGNVYDSCPGVSTWSVILFSIEPVLLFGFAGIVTLGVLKSVKRRLNIWKSLRI